MNLRSARDTTHLSSHHHDRQTNVDCAPVDASLITHVDTQRIPDLREALVEHLKHATTRRQLQLITTSTIRFEGPSPTIPNFIGISEPSAVTYPEHEEYRHRHDADVASIKPNNVHGFSIYTAQARSAASSLIQTLRDLMRKSPLKPWKTLKEINTFQVLQIFDVLQHEIGRVGLSSQYGRLCFRFSRGLSRLHGLLPRSLLIRILRLSQRAVDGGGFADIYQGQLAPFGCLVCVKVLRLHTAGTHAEYKKLRQLFCHEAMLWKVLHHPNILPLLGVNEDYGFALVSPWMAEGNINKFIERNPQTDLRTPFHEITAGVVYLHTFDPPVVHADLRGGNVVVGSDRVCRLADFGVAAVIESCRISSGTPALKGTFNWMAPELLDHYMHPGSLITKERDIYALGCTFLEVFTGKPPFSDPACKEPLSPLGAFIAVNRGDRPARPRHMPQELWWLITACWAQDPLARPSAETVLSHLATLSWPIFARVYPTKSCDHY